MRPYIMVMRDNFYFLIGPFDNKDHAHGWATGAGASVSDDPRWQQISLGPRLVEGVCFVIPPDDLDMDTMALCVNRAIALADALTGESNL